MALLIPDARGSLFGGLIDDAALLRPSPPTVEQAVEAYQRLRATGHGWIVGRLVVPASRLEELAGVLVRTLTSVSAPMPIVAVFDGDTTSDASIAAAVRQALPTSLTTSTEAVPSRSASRSAARATPSSRSSSTTRITKRSLTAARPPSRWVA